MAEDPFAVLGVPTGASRAELARARRRLAKEAHPDRDGGDGGRMAAINAAYDRLAAAAPPEPPMARPPEPAPDALAGFAIDALPVEAYQVLLPAMAELGEVLVEDDPYLLEGYLAEPAPCFYRLSLVPDAGGTTVSIEVERAEGAPRPDAEVVRDLVMGAVRALLGARDGPTW